MVLLIGNYAPDQQQSMLRFSSMMLEGLTAADVAAELLQPAPIFGTLANSRSALGKWLAYVDKFVLFPFRLRARARSADLVHICDHSNAMYAFQVRNVPVLVTCHDLLAVRGGLGEETDTPASVTGRWLQRWILAGLRKAVAIACDSEATLADAERLVRRETSGPRLKLVTLGLSYPYRPLPSEEARRRLASVPELKTDNGYVLHVGSNLRRKNREAILRIFARVREQWPGQLVFAGDPLDLALATQARALGVADRIVNVAQPPNELLEALYNCATLLLYPSRFEGFGWPIAEAQACGCPVLTSSVPPMTEVAGEGALFRSPDDEEGFAVDMARLTKPEENARWRERSLRNAERFTREKMIASYRELYRTLAPHL